MTMRTRSGAMTMTMLAGAMTGLGYPAAFAFGPDDCVLIDNGSFDDDLDGWTVDEQQSLLGDGEITIDTRVDDASLWFPWMDDHVLGVETAVIANGKEEAGFGEAFIDVRVSRPVVVTGSTLQFVISGGFDMTRWGEPEISYLIALEVTDPEEQVHTIEVAQHTYGVTPAFCDVAVSLSGFYNHPFSPNLTEIDVLEAAGVEIGDEVIVTIRYRVDAVAPTPCEAATYYATFLVDNFSFCDLANPADLNGDGVVNVTDLLQLLAAWGECGDDPCAADLTGDDAVGVADLLQLLGAWGDGP